MVGRDSRQESQSEAKSEQPQHTSRGEDTRERLILAARDCLLEFGHADSTVKRIAAKAGCNHGLIHHYFGSKNALWVEVLRHEGRSMEHEMVRVADELVEGFLIPQMMRNPERVSFVTEAIGLARHVPEVRVFLGEVIRQRRREFRALLGLKSEAEGALVFAAIFGLVLHAGVDHELPAEEAAHLLIRWARRDAP